MIIPIEYLVIAEIVLMGIIMVALSAGIITFGNLISKTPDMLERHGDRKEPTDAPAQHAVSFATAFCTIFTAGAVMVVLGGRVLLIVGEVVMFAAFLFSVTVLLWSMAIYKLMKKNEVELKGSIVA